MYGKPFKLFALFAILIATLSPSQTNATHAVGADIKYRWLGGNNYQFFVQFYRDCNGIYPPSQITFNISSASCGVNQNYSMPLVSSGGLEIAPICTLGVSTCNGGSVFGMQEFLYRVNITLPANCADWVFSYYTCCRNNAITNISSPGSMGQYFFSYLDNLNFPGNHSPYFVNKPAPYQCTNNPFCFDMSASDLEGDSLVYTFITPMRNSTTPITWLPGYSTPYPINSSPLMTLNNTSGISCVWPLSQGVYSMAIKVEEYRNGALMGTVMRDIQQNLQYCPCVTPLPVDLLDFSSEHRENGTVLLEWSTGSEFNSDHFVLERSFDTENFEHLGIISAYGNSNTVQDYDFIDDNLSNAPADIVYYRLTQFDLDGKSKVLKTIAQRIDRNIETIELLNNPIRDEVRLLFTDASAGNYEVSIIDTHGRVVQSIDYQKSRGLTTFNIPIDSSSAILYVNIRTPDNKIRVLKVVQL